MQIMN